MVSTAACEGSAIHWSYSGEEGPDNWAELSPAYAACDGENQSPINLTGFIEADLQPIVFTYQRGGNEILNNGHTVQVDYIQGSSIVVDGIRFNLKQFHFHAPSENHINGKPDPLAVHLVHADNDGNLAFIAVMFIEGKENKTLAQAWSHMPEESGDKQALQSPVAADGLLPSNRDYYRFNGSLTTPLCSEGVRWLIMKESVSASILQLQAFARTMQHPNNRPVQPTNARPVLK